MSSRPFVVEVPVPLKATPEEKANGWTDQTLREYFQQRENQKRSFAFGKKSRNTVTKNVTSFNPHRW